MVLMINFLFFITVLYQETVLGQQNCTDKFMDLSLVKYRAQNIGKESITEQYMASNALRVLWEYQFNCSSANITSLILGINIRRVTDCHRLFPSVQVFTSNGSHYDLVTGSERIIYYTTSNVSTNGMFEYLLDPPIKVMNGDVLAISQPFKKSSVVRVHYINGINFSSSMEYLIGSETIDLGNSVISNELILVYPITSGYCVNSTNSITAAFIKEKALEIQRSQPFHYLSQYIYPQIVFSCNGSVTKWIFGACSMGSSSQPELQIWRQTSTNNYRKVASSLVDTSILVGPNLFEFIPQAQLQFQEGDMLGVYSNINNADSLVLYEQRESGPMNLEIGPVFDSPLPTTVSHQLDAVTNNDFPLVTVEISSGIQPISAMYTSSTTKGTLIISSSLIADKSILVSSLSFQTDSTQPPLETATVVSIQPPLETVTVVSTLTEATPTLTTLSCSKISSDLVPWLIGGAVGVFLFIILFCLLVVGCTVAFMKKRKRNFGLEASRNYALEPDYITVDIETRMGSALNMAKDEDNYVFMT